MNGAALRKLREEKGLSLNELARISSMSKSYLSRIETGQQTNPSINILRRLAKALDCEFSNFYKKIGIYEHYNESNGQDNIE